MGPDGLTTLIAAVVGQKAQADKKAPERYERREILAAAGKRREVFAAAGRRAEHLVVALLARINRAGVQARLPAASRDSRFRCIVGWKVGPTSASGRCGSSALSLAASCGWEGVCERLFESGASGVGEMVADSSGEIPAHELATTAKLKERMGASAEVVAATREKEAAQERWEAEQRARAAEAAAAARAAFEKRAREFAEAAAAAAARQ